MLMSLGTNGPAIEVAVRVILLTLYALAASLRDRYGFPDGRNSCFAIVERASWMCSSSDFDVRSRSSTSAVAFWSLQAWYECTSCRIALVWEMIIFIAWIQVPGGCNQMLHLEIDARSRCCHSNIMTGFFCLRISPVKCTAVTDGRDLDC